MKMRFLAALAVATTGLIGAFNHGQAGPMALAASVSPVVAVAKTAAATSSTASTVPNPTTTPIFSSNFSGSSLNTSIWGTCYPWAPSAQAGCRNFGNNEVQWYLPSQVQVSGGDLNLVAQHVTTAGQTQSGAAQTYNCRSGMVTTYPSFSFEYGTVQVVANIPQTYGLWSGIWLLPKSEAWPPEIDMIETWGPPQTFAASTLHPIGGSQLQVSTTTPLPTGWHTYTLSWTPTSLTWWVDGTQVMTTSSLIPSTPMYLLLNLADYALTTSQGCSGTMQVSSVKVWAQS